MSDCDTMIDDDDDDDDDDDVDDDDDDDDDRLFREQKPPPRPKCQPKVIQDSNLDFRINSDSDPDVYWIASKVLWI